MRIFLLLAIFTIFLEVITANEDIEHYENHNESITDTLKTESRRIARQLNIPGQEYIVRGHSQGRQVIKIPGNARVKVVHPNSQQPQQRPTRGNKQPQQNRPSRQQPPQQKNRPKHPFDEDDYYDSPEEFKIPKKPIKKTKKGYSVQDISPEEFYDENSDEYEVFQKKPKQKHNSYQNQNQKKRHRKPEQNNYYDSNPQPSTPERRPFYDEETGYDFRRTRHRGQPTSYFDESYGYDDFGSSSSVMMKQVPPPNLALNVVDPPDLRKESHSVKKQMNNQHERYHNNYPTEPTVVKKPPSTRHMQSMFQQHYTTHNPHVTRNLGFDEHDNERASIYNSMDSDSHESQRHHDYDDQPHAASEHRPTLLPTGSSGIHIVKPPQFRDNVPVAAPTNQRATIRDILLQDCPEAESLGFCASPPRYPTQQINTMMSKCSDIIDAMYSPAPIDAEDDLSSFSSRSDDADIQFIDANITNNASDMLEEWPKWSRSSNDGLNTVCESVLTQTEPGYAREVSSGRWFVIMQTMDAIVQRVMTDTCDRPGKPCAGLAGLKCSRSSNSHHGYKATRCVQRYTQQRLISWDPETPQSCPKVRIFKFPSACLCHLSID